MRCLSKLSIIFGLTLALLTSCAVPIPTPDAKTPLKSSIFARLNNAPIYIARAEGFFEEEGLDIEWVEIRRGAEALPLLAQGDLDVVLASVNIGMFNAISRGSNIKIVADKGHIDDSECISYALVARNDLLDSGQLREADDIKGLRVNADDATLSGYYVEILLASVGLTLDDIDLYRLAQSDYLVALEDDAIDVVVSGEPFLTQAIDRGHANIWIPVRDFVPNSQHGVILYGPTLLDETHVAGDRYMRAYRRGVRQYNEGATERNLEILSESLGIEKELLAQMCWPQINEDGSINIDTILEFQEWAMNKGLADAYVSPEKLWDSSFIDATNE